MWTEDEDIYRVHCSCGHRFGMHYESASVPTMEGCSFLVCVCDKFADGKKLTTEEDFWAEFNE